MPSLPTLPSWIELSPLHMGERYLCCSNLDHFSYAFTYQFSRTRPTQINHRLTIASKPKSASHDVLADPPGLSCALGGIHASGDDVHEAFSYYGNSVIILENLARRPRTSPMPYFATKSSWHMPTSSSGTSNVTGWGENRHTKKGSEYICRIIYHKKKPKPTHIVTNCGTLEATAPAPLTFPSPNLNRSLAH